MTSIWPFYWYPKYTKTGMNPSLTYATGSGRETPDYAEIETKTDEYVATIQDLNHDGEIVRKFPLSMPLAVVMHYVTDCVIETWKK